MRKIINFERNKKSEITQIRKPCLCAECEYWTDGCSGNCSKGKYTSADMPKCKEFKEKEVVGDE